MRAHTAAHDVAMALRSSGIDARTYLCRAPLDSIDVRTPQQGRIQDFLKGGAGLAERFFARLTCAPGKFLELQCSELASGGFSVYRLVS